MVKKIALLLGTLGFLAVAGMAFADTASTTTTRAPTIMPSQYMILNIGPSGRVLLRGTVDSVSTSSVSVKSWGGDWTVNVPTSAEVMPRGVLLPNFKQGDFVGVQGTVNQGSNWTIDAALIRDWTQRQTMQENMQSVHQEMHSDIPRILQGTVSALSGQTFTLTAGTGTTYSVSLTTGAKILQRNWLTLDFSQVQNGDTVRVWGTVSSSTITASIFRDLSIPR